MRQGSSMIMKNESPDDAELVLRCQKKDREAFGQLVTRHAGAILNVVARMVGNQADAQDLVQETFVSAFRSLPKFRADSRFSTWLHRIAINKTKDWLRGQSRKREREVENDESRDITQTVPDDRTPETELSQKQTAHYMEEAIQVLPPLYREAFILKHVEGLDYEEMTEILGVGRDTLKMRVYKARTQLCRDLDWMRDHL